MSGIAPTTLQSYQAAFKLIIRHGVRTGVLPARLTVAQFADIPIFRWAALIKAFAVQPTNRRSYARQAYSALLLFPSLHLLRFEQSLRQLKRFWNVSTPRYSSFYDCRVLIKTLMSTDFTVSEEALRLRAIITMGILSLFRGIDLARTTRDIERGAVYFVSSRRKGRLVHQRYPVHKLEPAAVCPQNALDSYITATADYNGPELFVSLTEPRRAIKSDTINAITTKFLQEHNLQGFTAHSTRGASVTALILLGVDPHVVCALGDWKSYDCFRLFYDRVRACLPFTQVLVPKPSQGDQPRLPM